MAEVRLDEVARRRELHGSAYHSPLDDMRWVGGGEIGRSVEVASAFLLEFRRANR